MPYSYQDRMSTQRGGNAMLCGEVAKCREGMVYFYIFLELIGFFIDNLTL